MELFNGERLHQIDAVVFSEQLAPFPELLCHHHQLPSPPSIHSPGEGEINPVHGHNLPPQKLRPIRCNVRSSTDCQGSSAGALSGHHSADVEFLDRPIESGAGRGKGSGEQPSCDSEGRVGEHEPAQSTSSSSDGADESFSDIREPESRKRKRRAERKLQLALMENMAMKLMERQEQMHKQLMDMIENQERERISREEAWQRQEMERMKRHEELRAQETSRSLALISFIQKMLAQDFPETQTVKFCPEERQAETHPDEDVSSDSINKRWSDDEVQALISLRSALDRRFHAMASGGLVWEEISTGMSNMGYRRSAKKCKEKWENINKYFKKSTGEGKRQLENSKTCPYFRDLDILYKNGLVNWGNAPEVTKSVGGRKLASNEEVKSSMTGSGCVNNVKDSEGDLR